MTLKLASTEPIHQKLDITIDYLIKELKDKNPRFFDVPVTIVVNLKDKASVKYAELKKKMFNKYGFNVCLTDDDTVDINSSFIVQMPKSHPNWDYYPERYNYTNYLADIDGLCESNIYSLFINKKAPYHLPATVKAIDLIINEYYGSVKGASVCIAGKSTIIGKPLALHLMNQGATVTIFGKDNKLNAFRDFKNKDIVVLATPVSNLCNSDNFDKNLKLLIDAGTCYDEKGKVRGNFTHDPLSADMTDLDFYYTSVPNGVGPLTVKCLLLNHLMRGIYERNY